MDISNLKITSGVPVPDSRQRGGSGLSALFKSMEPGDSVFIPLGDTFKSSSLTSMCHTAAKNANIRVTIRKAEECLVDGPSCTFEYTFGVKTPPSKTVQHKPVIGYRVWRVDDPTDKSKPGGPRVGEDGPSPGSRVRTPRKKS